MLFQSYHEVAGPNVRNRGLPLPYKLAESICKTLHRNANDELELIQALDEYGTTHLLAHVTSNDQRRINLRRGSEITNPEVDYKVLSPIVFKGDSAKRDLQKKMEKLAKQGNSRKDLEDGFCRCLYEYGRLYKRILFDGLNCTELKIPSSSIPILSSTKIIAFSFTPWDSDWSKVARDTILDVGIAYARVSHAERALIPAREDTVRIKNGQNPTLKLRPHRPEVDYPGNPTQVQTLEISALRERLKGCFSQSVAENSAILLLNDEERTKDVLNIVFGIDVGELGWKRGLKELFAFGAGEPSSNGQYRRPRSRSPSRSHYRGRERDYASHSQPQRRPNQIYMVDIKGIYERLLKTKLRPKDESLNTRIMAMKMGLSISGGGDFDGGRGGWSAGLDAEILIEIFNKMIHGTSIDEEHEVLQALPLPKLPSRAIPSASGSNDVGAGEDDSDEERDPNDIQQKPLGGNGGMVEDDFSDYGDSDEEY
ncbi:hypothetical protein E1B28_012692 [Marasmius oreades]|uniref:Uncharacterized protein n=1 Tax=Marasmius oreades TaxID=181124 RepID=A0A9P7RS44_9AGAR|nr:uncharacterized protein E1B28_012692 [Marasmius oreades]KAG7088724.1 hypothetical protein E1B28_012692 [Marasmius oreades]